MFARTELITKEGVLRGEVPDLRGKIVDLDFSHARACGKVESQDGTRIKLAESDAVESNICSGVDLSWDSFVSGVARS